MKPKTCWNLNLKSDGTAVSRLHIGFAFPDSNIEALQHIALPEQVTLIHCLFQASVKF